MGVCAPSLWVEQEVSEKVMVSSIVGDFQFSAASVAVVVIVTVDGQGLIVTASSSGTGELQLALTILSQQLAPGCCPPRSQTAEKSVDCQKDTAACFFLLLFLLRLS